MNLSQNTTDKPSIGWIGLGKMGAPMSQQLIKAGYKMTIYDLSNEQMQRLVCNSVMAAESPEHVASRSDIIFSVISDDTALIDITLGQKGLLKGVRPGSLFVDMSTVSAGASKLVAEGTSQKGINYLRAPVSGSTVFAETGELTILASGPKESFDHCSKIFSLLSKKALFVGNNEEARYVKLLINMIVGISAAMTAEALTFGKQGGLDWEQMLDIVDCSVARSPLIGFKIPPLKERDFTPAFTISQMCKDFDIIMDTGNQMNTFMPLTSLVRQFMSAMRATKLGDLDYFGLVKLWEKMSNV